MNAQGMRGQFGQQPGGQPPETLGVVDLDVELLGQLAVVVSVQIEELAPRVRQAAAFDHALGQQRLVAGIVIAHELATPCAEEGLRMLA